MENNEIKISVKVQYDQQDILHISKVSSIKQILKIGVQGYIIIFFLGFVLITNILLGLSTNTSTGVEENVSSVSWLRLLIIVVVGIILSIVIKIAVKKAVLKNFKSNKEMNAEIDYFISEEEISGHSIVSDFHYNWSHFKKAIESKRAFILYLSNNSVICFPKRCFQDKDEIHIVKNLIKDKLPGKQYQTVNSK